jgi:2-polyprenyl-3-methyl-5-hydroxy-6-metoxy-1,4-benzoquinol methylase
MHPVPPTDLLADIYDDPYKSGTESYFTKVESKLRRSRGRVRRLLKYVPGGANGKAFLDIGCNGGFMTEVAREAGFSATGVDPDANSLAWARDHYPENHYIHGFFGDLPELRDEFDAVYCSEVIEHVPDSRRFVDALAARMKPGGVVYLTTPDISHWRRPRRLENWNAFCPPSHCVYFNPKNLMGLLAEYGIETVWRALSFKPGIKLIGRKTA